MYTIGQVGFGFLIPHDLQKAAEEEGLIEIIEGLPGVNTYYSGSYGVTPLLIGIENDEGIDEGSNVDLDLLMNKFPQPDLQRIEDIRKGVIDAVTAEFSINTPNLVEFVRWLSVEEPRKLIIWSTS